MIFQMVIQSLIDMYERIIIFLIIILKKSCVLCGGDV